MPTLVPAADEVLDRVLNSKTFAASPSSRRLLKYLAERTSAGDPDLKEYSIGVDVFGKSASYDPQRDSTVRIQVGRLRQRLADFYSTEGGQEPIVLDIPKGSFRLARFPNPRLGEPSAGQFSPEPGHPEAVGQVWRWIAFATSVAFLGLLVYTVVTRRVQPPLESVAWNSDLEELWKPLLEGTRPVLIAFSTPLFVEFQGSLLFRDKSEEAWEKIMTSEKTTAVSAALGNPPARATHYYAAAGEVGSAFALAKALVPRKPGISLVRDVQLTWQQLADNNIIFLGPPRFFRDRQVELPVDLEILAERDSFRVLHPRQGEPSNFPKNGVQGDGEAYTLVTNGPGPGGKGRILSFMSNDTFARQAAVHVLTDPEFARTLTAKLHETAGPRFPVHYQVLLRVKLKGGVMTEIHPVVVREVAARASR